MLAYIPPKNILLIWGDPHDSESLQNLSHWPLRREGSASAVTKILLSPSIGIITFSCISKLSNGTKNLPKAWSAHEQT